MFTTAVMSSFTGFCEAYSTRRTAGGPAYETCESTSWNDVDSNARNDVSQLCRILLNASDGSTTRDRCAATPSGPEITFKVRWLPSPSAKQKPFEVI